jgi:hypothetical protein
VYGAKLSARAKNHALGPAYVVVNSKDKWANFSITYKCGLEKRAVMELRLAFVISGPAALKCS